MELIDTNQEYFFRTDHIEDARGLVKKYHYSARPPGSVICVGTLHLSGGLFGDCGETIAACFFSSPPTRWSEHVLELSRLVRKDDVNVNLSYLISKTVRAPWGHISGLFLEISRSTKQKDGRSNCQWFIHSWPHM